ncbi:MAG: DUF167 domain-containing protein [Gemmatimonadales bacterium]|nr:DUF167 domain-containing protein [Gemmatimonadales bacterium]
MTARVTVQVQPRAKRTEVAGRHGDAVKVRVASPPVDGAANAELLRFLAERLGVPKSAFRIASGATGRRKTLEVEGLTTAEAVHLLLGSAP